MKLKMNLMINLYIYKYFKNVYNMNNNYINFN